MSAKGTVLKRVRQAKKASLRNKHYKSMLKTAFKKVDENIKDVNDSNFKNAISLIDKISKKGIIHKNTGNRYKSNLFKKIQNSNV